MALPEKTDIAKLVKSAAGFARTQELYTAVKLGIADQLAAGAEKADVLARKLEANPRALKSFLRVLVARGLLDQNEDGSFQLSGLGDLLRKDHPQSLRNRIMLFGEVSYQVGQNMLHTVRTGESAFEKAFGSPFWDYLSDHPEIRTLFNNQWSKAVIFLAKKIVEIYDFSNVGTIVDVAGGNGTLISAILKSYPGISGVVFDNPDVIAEALDNLTRDELRDRCETVAGNFFKDRIPSGRDIYLLSNIIHDWDDENAKAILENCRAAMRSDSKLLIVEQIMPERVFEGNATAGSDMSMLMLFNGVERTFLEFQDLLSASGFQILKAINFEPTQKYRAGNKTDWNIIECEIIKD